MYLIPLYLAIASRLCGTGDKYFGLILYALPYTLLVQLSTQSVILSLITLGWVIVWKLTGHADAFIDYQRDNFLSPFIQNLVPRSNVLYDYIFWAVKGAVIASLPSALTMTPILLITSVIGYPLAYYLAFNWLGIRKLTDKSFESIYFIIPPRLYLPEILRFYPIPIGETLAGFIAGLGFLSI